MPWSCRVRSRPWRSPAAPRSGNGFTQAEGILLEGIPTRIASRCVPLRAALPKGAYAAVRCTPDSAAVASVDYHLMDGDDAGRGLRGTMQHVQRAEAVSETETCEFGVKSQRVWIGNGWQSEGCYRTANRAELRFVDNATAVPAAQGRPEAPPEPRHLHGAPGQQW